MITREELERRKVRLVAGLTFAERTAMDLLIKLKVPVMVQEIVGPFICDFVGIERPFILELDGSVHDDRAEYDDSRSKKLESYGFQVFRLSNNDVNETTLLDCINQVKPIGAFSVRSLIDKVRR